MAAAVSVDFCCCCWKEEGEEEEEEDCSLSCVVYCLNLIHAEMSLVLCKYSVSSANGFIAARRWWMVISGKHLTVQRPYVRILNHKSEPADVVGVPHMPTTCSTFPPSSRGGSVYGRASSVNNIFLINLRVQSLKL